MKKVLIVDDAAFMRMMIKISLQKGGFEVAGEAEDGAEGVRLYKEIRPDIVTMDITMPNMDGLAALKEIKQFDPYARVIMISAMGQEIMVREAIMAGAKTFLIKPFKGDQMVQTINKVLGI